MRALPRLGDEAGLADREEASLVGKPLLGPRPQHDVHRLVEALAVLLLGDVIAAELGGAVAAAHADVEPPLGDDVDQRELLGQAQRVVEGEDRGGEPDAHAACAGGGGGGEAGRIDGEAVVDEVMLGEPDLVEAELLRPLHLLELAVHDLGVAQPRRGLEEEEGSETHAHLRPPILHGTAS
jgi:hypothetical protein